MAVWFEEQASGGHVLRWKVRQVLWDARSPYQHIQVLETESFGRALVLDDILQTAEGDEFIYHEMLALVALTTHPRPEAVLVVGGGDGGTVREVLRCPSVTHVVLAEIDREVTEASRRFLPAHTAGLDDPRVQVVYEDGSAYVSRHQGEFDVILVDATDPEGDGPGQVLYAPAFHRALEAALRPQGLYVQHTGAPFYNPEVLRSVAQSVHAVFPMVRVFATSIPTYPGGVFTFLVGSKGPDPLRPQGTWVPQGTRWYTPSVHRASFALPPYLARLLPPPVAQDQERATEEVWRR